MISLFLHFFGIAGALLPLSRSLPRLLSCSQVWERRRRRRWSLPCSSMPGPGFQLYERLANCELTVWVSQSVVVCLLWLISLFLCPYHYWSLTYCLYSLCLLNSKEVPPTSQLYSALCMKSSEVMITTFQESLSAHHHPPPTSCILLNRCNHLKGWIDWLISLIATQKQQKHPNSASK